MNIKDLKEIAATMKRVGVDEETIVDMTLKLIATPAQPVGWHKIGDEEYKACLFAE